mgnify:FL=1
MIGPPLREGEKLFALKKTAKQMNDNMDPPRGGSMTMHIYHHLSMCIHNRKDDECMYRYRGDIVDSDGLNIDSRL